MKKFKEYTFTTPKTALCEYTAVSKNAIAIIKDKNTEVVKEDQLKDKVIGLLKVSKIGDQHDYKLNDLYPYIYTGKKGQYKPGFGIIPKDFAILSIGNNKAPFHSGNMKKAESFLLKIINEYRFILAQDMDVDARTLLDRVSRNI